MLTGGGKPGPIGDFKSRGLQFESDSKAIERKKFSCF